MFNVDSQPLNTCEVNCRWAPYLETTGWQLNLRFDLDLNKTFQTTLWLIASWVSYFKVGLRTTELLWIFSKFMVNSFDVRIGRKLSTWEEVMKSLRIFRLELWQHWYDCNAWDIHIYKGDSTSYALYEHHPFALFELKILYKMKLPWSWVPRNGIMRSVLPSDCIYFCTCPCAPSFKIEYLDMIFCCH